ncbi:MAG: capsular polysaccharide biosynthesis protein Cps4B [Streptococcus sp.]|nr:capsular polysaccharide biosynthesis protein Cps4B [Streptococcus sp.]
MIDIHSHIIFDVDDGPKTLEESLELISESYRQGVRGIVSTSHRRKGMFETPESKIYDHFCVLKEEALAKFPDLQLYYGAELYYTSDIVDKLAEKVIPTMNQTQFALIEFSMNTSWKEIYSAVNKIIMQGITPIIAHIERYNVLENNYSRVEELINMGCYTQINSSHVLKVKLFGDREKLFKKRAHYFLEKNLVHCISSDMHNLDTRPPYMKEAYNLVKKQFGVRKANKLFVENALTLLNNEYI